jgi:uncharacterized membrane protein
MMTMNTRLAALAFAIAVAAVASPAVAQRNNNDEVSAARAADLRECNNVAKGYVDYNWGVRQSDVYRACMAEHGQPE